MANTSFPTAEAGSEPVVGQIVGDITLLEGGECAMPAERFEHWARHLGKSYPRNEHPRVYQMLGGMALEFAKRKAFASIQLFALATMGLPAPAREELRAGDDFLASAQAKAATKKLQAGASTQAGGLKAPGGAGPSLRPTKRKR